ncbi:ACP S-malonyltransferase [Thiohalophilus sp.]|uniref:ACP S-malonyltransferase n=1 Tax=Thiohalophilus sp. TaxID=3028392 RepID=UPI002ACD4548|nr:ACP S-malonyltransferase [Thiohalophilus sp.]MDZ7663047.1 ACP S-malonyltransferase [Thiohalophilus sp.]
MTLAFVFPGQGSQSQGMLKDLAEASPRVGETFALASEKLGYDLWQIVQDGPAEDLNRTDITQPAMLAAGVATWRVWQAQGGAMPALMAGHSLGEYSALVCAGSLNFSDAIALVAERGRLMQAAVPAGEGAMAAILGLDDDAVLQACEEAAEGEVLAPVNFNSPGQVVAAGNKSAVERLINVAKERGAKRALLLPVSVPSHCSLMQPAADKLASVLEQIEVKAPQVPVINNVDVATPDDPAAIRDALVRQLYNPVRWVETVQKMAADGVDRLIECGPGKVLVGLNKRIDKNMVAEAVFDSASIEAALQTGGE